MTNKKGKQKRQTKRTNKKGKQKGKQKGQATAGYERHHQATARGRVIF
jgi:hypothetical protein